MATRRLLGTLACAALLAMALSIAVGAQQPVSAPDQNPIITSDNGPIVDETPDLWFVELASPPAVEGTSSATLKAEKTTFRTAAAKAGIRFTERYAFDRLWNGLSIKIDPAQVSRLTLIDGVKAVYPVVQIDAPEPASPDPVADLYTATKMTGALAAQTDLKITGKGVKVGIIDTGVDYDHPDLGGNGTNGATPFPTKRVVTGYDFVGDAYGSTSTTPKPDDKPDDCNGHGTHVAGIVGANGPLFKGVAPDVTFGAYRVFGCSGSTSADIMIAAMERALADGMDVINMSIGSTYQWPEYPSAAAATRMVNKGVVVVASIGNDGEKGLAAASAPGVGAKVIGVASFDNTHVRLPYFTVNGAKYGYNAATGAPAAPTSGSLSMAKTGTPTTANDACSTLPAGSLTGKAVLIRRGTCSFYIKATNAQAAGAAAVVLYNNTAGFLNATVAPPTGSPAVTIPVVGLTAVDGVALNNAIAAGATTMTWTALQDSFANTSSGGLISSFSSYGLSPELSLKPDLGAPGGNITSTFPIEQGSYAVLSGTSMSSPHVAGTAALYLQAHPHTPAQAMRSILQNTAEPKNWSGNASLGLLDLVARQGAGMVQIDKAIQAPVKIEPGKLSLGESAAGDRVATLTLKNESGAAVTFDLSYVNGLSANNGDPAPYTNSDGSTSYYYAPKFYTGNTVVAFSAPSVTVPAGGTATVTATVTPASSPDKGFYGGYLVFTPQGGGGITLRVPYAGFVGDYQSIQVLKPLSYGFPWLTKRTATGYSKQADGASYTMTGTDIPYILAHFDYQSRLARMEVFDAASGKAWHLMAEYEYFGRNAATGYYAFGFNGQTISPSSKKGYTVPNGSYVIKLSVLKALGDENNPADWETWTSPMFYVSR